MPRFEADDGCPLYYDTLAEKAGGGPAIVFLNGTAQTTLNWRPFANRLKRAAQVVLYDARCQGRSGEGHHEPDLEQHARDLIQLLDHLDIARAGLMGLSHGARVALATARRFPDRVTRLMLLSLDLDTGMRARLTMASWRTILSECGLEALMRAMLPVVFSEAFLRQEARVLDKIVEALVQRNDAAKLNRLLAALGDYPPVAATLPEPGPPARVLAGADDPLVSSTGARALAERLQGSFRLLENTGHSIPAETPQGLLEEMTNVFDLEF